ncbi:L-dopachrome tautomerase yellow-f2-like [Battus philenor]|uniref:L-dopachrome tautomerase yellow-f2-like n=1 Tax=Battus philenor TaxID=42288 RepID=UPI0035D10BDD
MLIKTDNGLTCLSVLLLSASVQSQRRSLGKFQEVFAWKQLTYNIDGQIDEEGRFFVQYNNVPMGVELVGERLFVTVPRRRHGIPSTLNYINMKTDSNTRSPSLRPYPSLGQSRDLTSVYRTRADECGRLWMVDTGLLEIPDAPQQVQAPAIVVYDLSTDKQILRYQFKESDIPAANTPTGLASITVDIGDDCANAFAYVPDLTTFGLIVFSLRERDSWRLNHNYFYLSPTAGNFRIAGQSFQWSDGIFSLTLTESGADNCRTAYFHPLASFEEFSVSTCVLKNKTAGQDSDFWRKFSKVGDRGQDSQSTMHGYHAGTRTVFFAEIGRDSVSCWGTGQVLTPNNVVILAQDRQLMSYPSDLHVTGDEVWVMANTLPRFGYSMLDTNEYNFYIYRGYVNNLIAGTVCENGFSKRNY